MPTERQGPLTAHACIAWRRALLALHAWHPASRSQLRARCPSQFPGVSLAHSYASVPIMPHKHGLDMSPSGLWWWPPHDSDERIAATGQNIVCLGCATPCTPVRGSLHPAGQA